MRHRFRATGVLDIEGPDREPFLQGQLTQDVRGLAPGDVRPTAGLTPKGKLLYVARVLGLPDRIRLLVPAFLAPSVAAHLTKYAVFQKVGVADLSGLWLRVGLTGGPPPSDLPPGTLDLPGEGEFDAELLAPESERRALTARLERAGSRELSETEAEVLRIKAGRPRFGQDMDGTNLPDELELEAAISRTKGCYVGQEIVARLATYGRVNRRLVGFRFPQGVIPAGTALSHPDPSADPKIAWGRVTSSAEANDLGPIGLGFAFRDVPPGGRLVADGPPRREALVSPLPFA
jgi:folate-binding protein YgfZ